MRHPLTRLLLVSVPFFLASCGNDPPSPNSAPVTPPTAPPTETPSHRNLDIVPEQATVDGRDVLAFRVNLQRAQIKIADVAMSTDLVGVLSRTGASLAVNGGFFTPDTQPEGLAVSEGRELSPRSLALGGGVLAIARRRAQLFAAEDYTPPEGLDFAIQCRPRLVVDRAPHVKKDDGREAERTALCLRDATTMELVLAVNGQSEHGLTLSAWSSLLSARGCEAALNLDGGPSTGAAWREGEAVRTASPRAGIRHAIVVFME